MANSITSDGAGVANPFFSILDSTVQGIGEGLGFIGREIFPRWTAQQVVDQRFDNLRNPLFQSAAFVPSGTILTPDPKPAGLLFDNINLTGGGLLIAAAAIIAVILIFRA